MNQPMYYALIGSAGSGKDTVADYLVREYEFVKCSSGDPIKDVCMRHFGMSWEDCYTHAGKAREHPYIEGVFAKGEGRLFLRFYHPGEHYSPATEQILPMLNREVQEQLGDRLTEIDKLVLMRQMDALHAETGRPVVDCSTREEAQARFVKSRGGVIIHVHRREAEEKAGSHHSATFWRRWKSDYVLDNNATLEELFERTDLLMSQLGHTR